MKPVQSRRSLALSAVCLLSVLNLMALPAQAQTSYPTKSVRIVVGFSAGGSTDVLARILAKDMAEDLGQSFVVENKPGAGSNIAAELVVRAAPDGYTLFMMAVTNAINQTLYSNLKFDVIKDFSPIGLAAKVPNMLVIYPKVPVNSVQELIAYAKKNPSALNFASSGAGTSIHMTGELFKLTTKLDIPHIPYKGSTPAMNDTIGGQVPMAYDTILATTPQHNAGRVRALAVTSINRSALLPNIPTLAESGLKDFNIVAWQAVVGPKGLPADVKARMLALTPRNYIGMAQTLAKTVE
jgi:tripartite-type tricarboxylate transporter receptor subunit TctC